MVVVEEPHRGDGPQHVQHQHQAPGRHCRAGLVPGGTYDQVVDEQRDGEVGGGVDVEEGRGEWQVVLGPRQGLRHECWVAQPWSAGEPSRARLK